MASEDLSDTGFYADLKEPLRLQKMALSDINEHLVRAGVKEISSSNEIKSITAILERGQLSSDVTKRIDSYIQLSVRLADAVGSYIEDFEHDWKVKQKKSADVRKAERDAMWILWIQRTARWTAGAILFVLLYSAIIWASENSSFVKVPVRDLVIPHDEK